MHQMLSTTLRPPGVHMEQKSRSKVMPWSGFEPRASHMEVQHATARPPRTRTAWYQRPLASPFSFLKAWDWHYQSTNGDGVELSADVEM